MTLKHLVFAAAASLALYTSAAEGAELVKAVNVSDKELLGGINQDRFDLGFRFTIQGVAQQVVPGGLLASDAILCNLSKTEGGYATNGVKHRLAPMTCVPLNGFNALDVNAEQQWTGAILLRAHAP